MDMQKKIELAIKAIAEKNGYTVDTSSFAVNKTKNYIAPAGSFANVLTFSADFQHDYASIYFFDGDNEPLATDRLRLLITSTGMIRGFVFQYNETQKINEMLELVKKHCPFIPDSKRVKAIA